MNIDPFGPDATLHHVGLVVASISAVAPDNEIFFDPIQKVKVSFISIQGMPVELIEPQGEESPVMQSLRKGTKLVHFCYEVDNLKAAIVLCTQDGFRYIAKPVPAVAFNQRHIAWVFHRVFGLFELLER